MIKILIVDDQNTVRQILKNYLENETDFTIVGFAIDGQTAIKQVENLKPDVVVMDIEMPVMDGLTATQIISEQYLTTKIVFFTNYDELEYFSQALKVGASGYLLKRSTPEEIKSAIRTVYHGSFHLNIDLFQRYLDRFSQPNTDSSEIVKLQKMLTQQSSLIEKLITKSQNKIVKKTPPELEIKQEFDKIWTEIKTLKRLREEQARFLSQYFPDLQNDKKRTRKVQKILLVWISLLSILVLLNAFVI